MSAPAWDDEIRADVVEPRPWQELAKRRATEMGDIPNRKASVKTRLAAARIDERNAILSYLRRRLADPGRLDAWATLDDATAAIVRGEHHKPPERRL